MTTLKSKIKIIPSLPPSPEDKDKKTNLIITLVIVIIISLLIYLSYIQLKPYIYATNINKITGKKININPCNTKDYIIINKDKSYSMSLTNIECKQSNYEGNLYIKDKTVIFTYITEEKTNTSKNKTIKHKIIGTINENYNIIINNNIFEEEKNNEITTTTNTK